MKLVEALKYGFAAYGLYSLVKRVHDMIPEDEPEEEHPYVAKNILICGDTPSETLKMYSELLKCGKEVITVTYICELVEKYNGDATSIRAGFNDPDKYGWTKEDFEIDLDTDEDGTVWLNLGTAFPFA